MDIFSITTDCTEGEGLTYINQALILTTVENMGSAIDFCSIWVQSLVLTQGL